MEAIAAKYHLPETPDCIELKPGQRVVALGDIHGNWRQLVLGLKAGGVIPVDDDDDDSSATRQWIGGDTILVQVGDVLDRGDKELECWALLCDLARQAKKVGGAVVLLWGNHEVWNVEENYFQSIHDGETWSNEFGAALVDKYGDLWKLGLPANSQRFPDLDPARLLATRKNGLLAKPLLSKLKVMAKVGQTLFVHAGGKTDALQEYIDICTINRAARDWLLEGDRSKDFPEKLSDMLWTRDFAPMSAGGDPDEIEAELDSVLTTLGVSRMVVGHSVQKCVKSMFGKKVWCIDIGNGLPSHARCGLNFDDLSSFQSEVLEIRQEHDEKESLTILRSTQRKETGTAIVRREVPDSVMPMIVEPIDDTKSILMPPRFR